VAITAGPEQWVRGLRGARPWLCVGAAALGLALSVPGAARAVEFGATPPSLDVKKWLAGEPLALGEAGGRVVVVEFWATRDAGSRKAIRRLSYFQRFHGSEVDIVAVTDEEAAVVGKFLAESPLPYRVALDAGSATKLAWMRGISGIPHAFIVGRDGRVAWHGEPEVGLAAALNDLLAGKFDAARYEKLNELRRQLLWAIKAGKVGEAMSLLDQMIAAVPQDGWAYETKAAILARQHKLPEARDAYLAMGKACSGDPEALCEAAERLATTRYLHVRDLRGALGFAERAAEVTTRKDPYVLSTLARVRYELGHLGGAVDAQRLAVEAAAEGERPLLEAVLLFYRTERLRRTADPEAK